VQYNIL